jgi:hypothetical protein
LSPLEIPLVEGFESGFLFQKTQFTQLNWLNQNFDIFRYGMFGCSTSVAMNYSILGKRSNSGDMAQTPCHRFAIVSFSKKFVTFFVFRSHRGGGITSFSSASDIAFTLLIGIVLFRK